MPEPDLSYPGRGDEDALFAQFVTGPQLPIRRELQGEIKHSLFNIFFNSVFEIRLAAGFVEKGVQAALVAGIAVPVEVVAGKAHNFTGF